MTINVDVVNRALQEIGTRTTVSFAELRDNTTNEAIQANLVLLPMRDALLRMAPWNCSFNFAMLTYITSVPGTPENTSGGTTLWAKGQPPPPWMYEYQYPVDCLRACWVAPGSLTAFGGGTPFTTAVTGGGPMLWPGPPIRFKEAVDQFIPVNGTTIASGGTGHAVGDLITLPGTPQGQAPIGAPAQITVTAVGPGGVITSASVEGVLPGETVGGSYFAQQPNPVPQASTTGVGIGASFNLIYNPKGDQKVILTNQQNALLAYVKQITDPNVMDTLFVDAWAKVLASRLVMALRGDKGLANMKIVEANGIITEARKVDGNEGLTVNDVTPDWIRIRGISQDNFAWSPNQYEWGPLWAVY